VWISIYLTLDNERYVLEAPPDMVSCSYPLRWIGVGIPPVGILGLTSVDGDALTGDYGSSAGVYDRVSRAYPELYSS